MRLSSPFAAVTLARKRMGGREMAMKRMGHRGGERRGCRLSGLRVRDAEGMAVEARGSDCSADRRRKITNAKCNGGLREGGREGRSSLAERSALRFAKELPPTSSPLPTRFYGRRFFRPVRKRRVGNPVAAVVVRPLLSPSLIFGLANPFLPLPLALLCLILPGAWSE